MNDTRLEIRVQVPAEVVWNLWAGFANASRWNTDMRQCRLEGPFQGLCPLKNSLKTPLVLELVNPRRS